MQTMTWSNIFVHETFEYSSPGNNWEWNLGPNEVHNIHLKKFKGPKVGRKMGWGCSGGVRCVGRDRYNQDNHIHI